MPPSLPAAGNYTFQLSAWNAIGESALSDPSAVIDVAFSTSPRFWSVQGSSSGATLNVIRPDSVAEPDNMLYKVAILQAGDSGSGAFRPATLETYTGTGSLASPAVFTIPLSAFGEGVAYAQVNHLLSFSMCSGSGCEGKPVHVADGTALLRCRPALWSSQPMPQAASKLLLRNHPS